MVKMQIEINTELRNKLKISADKNLRSMRNELLIILKNSLDKVEIEQFKQTEPKKNLINMETCFIQ